MKQRFDEDGFKHTYGPEWLRVSSMACAVCGDRGWWAHHVVPVGRGGRDLDNCCPLCLAHHTEVETVGRKTFESKHGVDLEQLARSAGLRSPYREREGRIGAVGEVC